MARIRRSIKHIKKTLLDRLTEKLYRQVAERYGFRWGPFSKLVIKPIDRVLRLKTRCLEGSVITSIVGLGLRSSYMWEGEDLVEALRRRFGAVSNSY